AGSLGLAGGVRGSANEGYARAGHPWPSLPLSRLTASASPWLRPAREPPHSHYPSPHPRTESAGGASLSPRSAVFDQAERVVVGVGHDADANAAADVVHRAERGGVPPLGGGDVGH